MPLSCLMWNKHFLKEVELDISFHSLEKMQYLNTEKCAVPCGFNWNIATILRLCCGIKSVRRQRQTASVSNAQRRRQFQ